MMGNYYQRDYEKVEKALNIKLKSVSNEADQLPDDIDVTYTKSNVGESELVNDVVENVLKIKIKMIPPKMKFSYHKLKLKKAFTRII
ncbi:hypothetical protein Hanom_Chr02g00145201 [Helianthus anomalus]